MTLKEAREKRNLSQTELADMIGIKAAGKSRISQWETGQRNPGNRTLLKLKEALNCSVNFDGDGKPVFTLRRK